MGTVVVNGVRLYVEEAGQGEPLVLIHGSWGDLNSWDAVMPGLASAFRVVRYDRRGHTRSERPGDPGNIHEDVADAAALIEVMVGAPAFVLGNSSGAFIALRLAATRPDLVRSLVVHEPPLFDLLVEDESMKRVYEERVAHHVAVAHLLEAGQIEAGTRRFIDMAFGPDAWQQLPQRLKEAFMFNAPTWLDEWHDDAISTIDLAALSAYRAPALVSYGTESPSGFREIVIRVASALPGGELVEIPGAGHVPHRTDSERYVQLVTRFLTPVRAQQR